MTGQPTTIAPDSPLPPPQDAGVGDAAELVAEDRFSIVPEWVLDADIGDCALRLYAVLLRYGNTTGARMPARSTLAARLHKKSTDTVDRALAELVALGAVQVEHRWAGGQRLTNRYRIRTSRPSTQRQAPTAAASDDAERRGGRTDAATRTDAAGSGRNDRGRVAARIRQDREFSTQKPPPPPAPSATAPTKPTHGPNATAVQGGACRPRRRTDRGDHWRQRREGFLHDCGLTSTQAWDDFVAVVRTTRGQAGQPLSRWSATHLLTSLDLAVRGRGWPAEHATTALLSVAADPATRSPARLAEAGPWWDQPDRDATGRTAVEQAADVAALDRELDGVDGLRTHLQQRARHHLATHNQPLTRPAVLARAVELLHQHAATTTEEASAPDTVANQ